MTQDDGVETGRRFSGPWWLRIVGLTVVGVVGGAAFALAFGYFVKLLWNWLMPGIFGLGTISYWQAFGVVILAKLIFGGIGGAGHHGSRHGERRESRYGKGGSWRSFWEEEGKKAFRSYVERRRAADQRDAEASGQASADESPER